MNSWINAVLYRQKQVKKNNNLGLSNFEEVWKNVCSVTRGLCEWQNKFELLKHLAACANCIYERSISVDPLWFGALDSWLHFDVLAPCKNAHCTTKVNRFGFHFGSSHVLITWLSSAAKWCPIKSQIACEIVNSKFIDLMYQPGLGLERGSFMGTDRIASVQPRFTDTDPR